MTKGKKHMDGTKRCRIESDLAAGESERQIAKEIGVSRAQEEYLRDLSEKRQGAALEPWEREYIDELVSPKIKAGQSVHHICVTNAAKLTRNERTIQRYVNYGVLPARPGAAAHLTCSQLHLLCLLT